MLRPRPRHANRSVVRVSITLNDRDPLDAAVLQFARTAYGDMPLAYSIRELLANAVANLPPEGAAIAAARHAAWHDTSTRARELFGLAFEQARRALLAEVG